MQLRVFRYTCDDLVSVLSFEMYNSAKNKCIYLSWRGFYL